MLEWDLYEELCVNLKQILYKAEMIIYGGWGMEMDGEYKYERGWGSLEA